MNYGGGYEAYGNDDYGGGGFMDGASQSQSTPSKGGRGGGGGGGRSRDAQTLRSLTIKQLLNRSEADDAIRVDGQEVSNVKIVGILGNVVPHSTNVNFQLDDGTGVIDGRMFLHADDAEYAESEVAKLRDGIYVRVVGNVRTFQDKLSLSCFSVTPIEDFNELTHHFLDAIYVNCYFSKGPLQAGGGKAPAGGAAAGVQAGGAFGGAGGYGQQQQTWGQQQGNDMYLGHSNAGMGAGAMDYNMDSSFSPEQKAILDVLGTCTSDRGLKIDQIFADLRGRMSEDQLRDALNYLTSEGHVYSTIDENHFKRTA